jgi:hypothetical protein
MQPSYPFIFDVGQWAVVAFVLAMTFLSGLLGGYLFGLTHTVRHGDGGGGSKSIWTYEDED